MFETIYQPIDMAKNEIQNHVLHNLGSAPVAPVAGQIYYDTTDSEAYVYNGSAWDIITVSPTGAVGSVNSITVNSPLLDTGTSADPVLELQSASNTQAGYLSASGHTTLNTLTTGGIVLGGDVSANGFVGSTIVVTVNTVGGKTSGDIATAVDNSHVQNTDTGTTSDTFAIDSGDAVSGVVLKAIHGRMELRNIGDSSFADLRIKDLFVEGDTTIIQSNTVEIGDSTIELNADITDDALNSDGGITVKRLQSDDTTRADASVIFNNSTGFWEVTYGDVTGVQTKQVAMKHVATLGDGASTTFNVIHNLNSRDIVWQVRETAGNYGYVSPRIRNTNTTTTAITFFGKTPTSAEFTAIAIG